MSREWRPGDVVLVEWFAGDGPVLMFRTAAGAHCPSHHPRREHWHSAKNTFAENVDAAEWFRPLVVIDPEDREQMERLTRALYPGGGAESAFPFVQAALREFANPTPPKPAEPTGLGAVVEDAHFMWVRARMSDGPADVPQWRSFPGGQWKHWADIDAVRVLSEGVAP